MQYDPITPAISLLRPEMLKYKLSSLMQSYPSFRKIRAVSVTNVQDATKSYAVCWPRSPPINRETGFRFCIIFVKAVLNMTF